MIKLSTFVFKKYAFFNLSAKVVGLLAEKSYLFDLIVERRVAGEVTARIYWFLSFAVSGLRLGVVGGGGSLRRYGTRFGVTT